jgi:hypothetical protein
MSSNNHFVITIPSRENKFIELTSNNNETKPLSEKNVEEFNSFVNLSELNDLNDLNDLNNLNTNIKNVKNNVIHLGETNDLNDKRSWDGSSNPSDSSPETSNDEENQFGNIKQRNLNSKEILYKKITFSSLKKQINESYEQDIVHKYSSALDILASYLKGQKIIYMESRTVTLWQLNRLMLPSIFFTSSCAVLSPLSNKWFGYIFTCNNKLYEIRCGV